MKSALDALSVVAWIGVLLVFGACVAGTPNEARSSAMSRVCAADSHCRPDQFCSFSDGVCVARAPRTPEDSSSDTEADSGAIDAVPPPVVARRSPADCPLGSVQCDGRAVVRCAGDGRSEVEEDCAFACESGACTGFCTPDTTRCDGQSRQRCDAEGDWQPIETCPKVCTPDGCIDSCLEGALECNDTSVVQCDGGRFVEQIACTSVCKGGGCTGACSPGSRRCANGAASTCSADGTWTAPVDCANECVEGVCTGLCTPGSLRCAGASHYQKCGQLGQWSDSQTCDGLACSQGRCTGECAPGSSRCEGRAERAICNERSEWDTPMTCGRACVDGECTGECVPGSVRCDPSGAPRVQLCLDHGVWQRDAICEYGACQDGACLVTPVCEPGHSPNWSSPPAGGGSQTLDDPRWQPGAIAEFASAGNLALGGYLVVFDRATQELAVSFRVTLGGDEVPGTADYVFFGITPNAPGAPAARRVVIPLIELAIGDKARPITAFQTAEFAGMWRDDRAAQPWIRDVSAWRGNLTDALSWAINFRVGLATAQVDPKSPVRISLAAHADTSNVGLTTPADAGSLTERPEAWAHGVFDEAACVSRVTLE